MRKRRDVSVLRFAVRAAALTERERPRPPPGAFLKPTDVAEKKLPSDLHAQATLGAPNRSGPAPSTSLSARFWRTLTPLCGRLITEVVSSPWENLRGGLVLGREGLWNQVRRLVADSDGDEEIRWHRRASAEEASRRIHSLVEQETDRRVAICIWRRVRLGGERMTEVAADYGYRDGSGVHRVLQRLDEKAQHDHSLARHLKKLAEQMSSVKS